MTGYEALREGAAIWDVSSRGRIRATGEDRKRLLHAMSTNHVQALEPGQGLYTFFLNAQGRILADAVILCEDEALLIECEPQSREFLLGHIDKFIIADDVTLEDVTPATFEFALEGPHSLKVASTAGLVVPEQEFHFAVTEDVTVVRASLTGQPGVRVIGLSSEHERWLQRLTETGAISATDAEAEMVRLETGKARYGADITDANLVQETGLLQAVHFSKGCYLGQEIVERVRSQGHVNRLLSALRIETAEPVEPGTPVLADGKEVGKITSSILSPAENRVRALGYVRVAGRQAGVPLQVNGVSAELVSA